MREVVALVKKVGPSNVPVLIAGETGSGKEVIAELIHASSERHGKEMLCINCAEFPPDIIESELFGHERGSFTGGNRDRVGLLENADGTTVFLDELSEMPLNLQSKLLRVIQTQRVRRVGTNAYRQINVRFIASVNREPKAAIAALCLREDIYYRLSTITINVPPLRERYDDIIPLAKAYLTYFCKQHHREMPKLPERAVRALLKHAWPGNVRELMNEINRATLLCNGSVTPRHFSFFTSAGGEQGAAPIPSPDRSASSAQPNGHVAAPTPARPAPHTSERSAESSSGSSVGLQPGGFLD